MSRRPPKPPAAAREVSKADAAGFLRVLAQNVGKRVPKSYQITRARELQLIANCIEGKIRWKKGSAFTWQEERDIALALVVIEQRPSDMTLKTAVDKHAERLAAKWTNRTKGKFAARIQNVRRSRK